MTSVKLAQDDLASLGLGGCPGGREEFSSRRDRSGGQILDADPAVVWNPKDEGFISDGSGVIAPIV
jgi:hypothetical protein